MVNLSLCVPLACLDKQVHKWKTVNKTYYTVHFVSLLVRLLFTQLNLKSLEMENIQLRIGKQIAIENLALHLGINAKSVFRSLLRSHGY